MKDAPSRELKLFGNKKERQHYGELQHSEISGHHLVDTGCFKDQPPHGLAPEFTPMKV